MNESLILDLGFGKLKAYIFDQDGFKEIYIDFIHPNGEEQSIAVIGNHYHIDNELTVETLKSHIRLCVYNDIQVEDYTHRFLISTLEEDDDPMDINSVVFRHYQKK